MEEHKKELEQTTNETLDKQLADKLALDIYTELYLDLVEKQNDSIYNSAQLTLVEDYLKKTKLHNVKKHCKNLEQLTRLDFQGKGKYTYILIGPFGLRLAELAKTNDSLLVKEYKCKQTKEGTWDIDNTELNSHLIPPTYLCEDKKLYLHKEKALKQGLKELNKQKQALKKLAQQQIQNLHDYLQTKLDPQLNDKTKQAVENKITELLKRQFKLEKQ